MFAYCLNNPVNWFDASGTEAVQISIFVVAIIAAAVLGVVGLLISTVEIIATFLNQAISAWIDPFPRLSYETEINSAKTKGKENVRDSGLANESDELVQRKAHDNSLPKSEKKKYQKEEKARGLRNRAKRQELHRKLTY